MTQTNETIAAAANPQTKRPRKMTREPKASVAEAKAKADATPTSPKRESKADLVLGLLKRPEGATIDQLVAATGWLPRRADRTQEEGACGQQREAGRPGSGLPGGGSLMARRPYVTLGRLAELPPEELKTEWARRFGVPAPLLSPELLQLGIGYKLQEQKYGGLSRRTRSLLRQVGGRGESSDTNRPLPRKLTAGTGWCATCMTSVTP